MRITDSCLVPSSFTSGPILSISTWATALYRLVGVIVRLLYPSRLSSSQAAYVTADVAIHDEYRCLGWTIFIDPASLVVLFS